MGEWWKETTWCIASLLPPLKKRMNGSTASSTKKKELAASRSRKCCFSQTLTYVCLFLVQISCQRRPFLRNASCQEEAYIPEEEGGTAIVFFHHLPQLLPAQNSSWICPWTSVFLFPPAKSSAYWVSCLYISELRERHTESEELRCSGCRLLLLLFLLLLLSVLFLTLTWHITVRARCHSGFLCTLPWTHILDHSHTNVVHSQNQTFPFLSISI